MAKRAARIVEQTLVAPPQPDMIGSVEVKQRNMITAIIHVLESLIGFGFYDHVAVQLSVHLLAAFEVRKTAAIPPNKTRCRFLLRPGRSAQRMAKHSFP